MLTWRLQLLTTPVCCCCCRWARNAAAFGDQVALLEPHRSPAVSVTYRCVCVCGVSAVHCCTRSQAQKCTAASRCSRMCMLQTDRLIGCVFSGRPICHCPRELSELITDYAAGLQAHGLQQGDRVSDAA
jgi:hypothetical protein